MQMVIYLVVGLSLTWVLYLLYIHLESKSIEGRDTKDLVNLIPDLHNHPNKALIYCFSKTCAPCSSMTPLIDEMHAEGEPVFKVNISEHADIAKDIGIKGVPTLLLINHGTITRVVLGSQSRKQIETLLGS